jgi:hypothetical protein
MVYSRYARRKEDSIRRAFRLLKVRDAHTARKLLRRSRPGSRLRHFATTSPEAGFKAGLADALLHPCVRSFRIDELMELVDSSGLQPLLFSHADALEGIEDERERIRGMEARHDSPGNFVLYLGRGVSGPRHGKNGSLLMLSPCLRDSVGLFRLTPAHIPARLGHPTPPLGWKARNFLRRFIGPVPWDSLSPESQVTADIYIKALFLLQYRP